MSRHRQPAYPTSSPAQRPPQSRAHEASVEWPTLALWLTIVGGWALVLVIGTYLPSALRFAALVGLAAWYMSLQHELLHGHPTRLDWLNRLLGLLPIALWYPYDLYKAHHLTHHQDQHLTEPGVDPESNYRHADTPLARWQRTLLTTQRTVAGRLLLGPGITIAHLLADIARAIKHRNTRQLWLWAQHLALAVALLTLIPESIWEYMAAAYLGLGLAMLRSLYEHRPAKLPAHRVVINEAALPWRLLYLNNNYHAVHHTHPGLPWYRIPEQYRADRSGYLQRNGGFLVPGYLWLLRRHLWKPIDSPILPEKA